MHGLLSSMFSHVMLICACKFTDECDVFVCADVCVQMSVYARCVPVHADVCSYMFFCADVSGAVCGSHCCVLLCECSCVPDVQLCVLCVYTGVCAAVRL